MSEFTLAFSCALAALIILVSPQQALATGALADLGWLFDPRYLAIPFGIKTTLTGSGLVLNVMGYPISRLLRFFGALVGFFIWSWLSAKLILINTLLFGCIFTVPSAFVSVRIMAYALADLPPPGAPGRNV